MRLENMASRVHGSTHKKKRSQWKKPIPEVTPHSKKKQTASTSVTSIAPRGINVAEFAESRALEIHNMVEAMGHADRASRKRLFQQLPRHMRRRAMSHNVKRLPVRLREEAQAEMDKFPKQNEGKKKSRRYRRKPKNLLAEYTRRQRQHMWLETHIWHAKRMKMVDIWGFRLAEHPCDKGFRAAHRAVTSSCTLQDISYYGCIEISGKQTQIIAAIGHITNQDAGLTIKSPQYLSGCREGHLVLYHINKYPYGAIGPVSFVWRQSKCTHSHEDTNKVSPPSAKKPKLECVEFYQPDIESDISQLWFWSHPACFNEVFDVIVEACKRVSLTVVKKDNPPDLGKSLEKQSKDKSQDISTITAGNKPETPSNLGITACGITDSTCNNGEHTEDVLTVSSLRQELVRFRLTGPQSHTLLHSALVLHNLDGQAASATTNGMDTAENSLSSDLGITAKQEKNKKWWKECSSDIIEKQNELWINLKQVSGPGLLPSGCAVSLIVMDPRLNMPHKKMSVDSAAEETSERDVGGAASCYLPCPTKFLVQWPKGLAVSPIWVCDTRTVVKETKMSEHELNKSRSEQLVPGTEPHLADDASRIPILLLQQPSSSGTCRSQNSCQGYGGGWDIILPSGWGMPFWMALIYRGARAVGLKEARICALEKGEPCFPRDFPDTAAGQAYNESLRVDGEQQYSRYPPAKRPNYHKLGFLSPFSCPFNRLVEEWRSMSSEGISGQVAVASSFQLSTEEVNFQMELDYSYVLRSKSILSNLRQAFSTPNPNKGEKTESGKNSPFKLLPEVSNHNDSLVCVSLRMFSRGSPHPFAAIAIPTLGDLRSLNKKNSFSGPVEPLHKGSREQPSKNLIGCCTREIIGYATAGDYSLARGGGAGLGFCVLRGIVKAFEVVKENSEFVVLVRNTNTQQYRFAYLNVV